MRAIVLIENDSTDVFRLYDVRFLADVTQRQLLHVSRRATESFQDGVDPHHLSYESKRKKNIMNSKEPFYSYYFFYNY